MLLRAFLLAALIVPACAAVARVSSFERLGSFVGRGGSMSMMVGPGPSGSERVYVCYTYLSSLDLVAYDLTTGQYKVWTNPEGGAWAMEVGPDRRLYLGTYFNGHVLRLDPETGKLDDLGQAIAGETYIWQLSRGPDGKLYGCTYPGAKLLCVDPSTGALQDLGKMDPVQNYNRTLCAAPDGWVYCGIGSEKQNLVAYSVKTHEVRGLLAETDRTPGFGQVFRGEDGSAYGTAAGHTYRLRDGRAEPIGEAPRPASRLQLRDGRTASDPGTYPGRDLPIFRVAAGPDSKVYGSSILPEYLLRFDPKDPKPVTMGLIPGAEAYSMLAAHGRLFIASYTGATLQAYDPAKPFDPGADRKHNPSWYGQTAQRQDRPYDIALSPDGRVYLACVPAYGYHGGAISWYDPGTDSVDHVSTPVPDQAIASICALPSGMLVCGTSTEGGPGTKPIAREAVLFLWDPAKKAKVWETVPLPGVSAIGNLAAGADGLVYGSAGNTVFALDPSRRQVVSTTRLEQGAVCRAGLLALDDGRVAAIAGRSAVLVSYARGRWSIVQFAQCDAALTTGKAVVDGWLYAAADKQLVRCRVPARQAR